MLVVAPDGTIVVVNRQLERQFGYDRQELIGRSVDALLPDALGEVHATHRRSFMASPEVRSMGVERELFGRRKDGSQIPVEIGLNPIPTEAGVFVLASVVDITERRRLQTEHDRALEEAVQFDRMVSELGGGIRGRASRQARPAIDDSQRRILEALDLDRGAIFQLSGDDDLVLTHHWSRPGLTQPVPSQVSAMRTFPWSLKKGAERGDREFFVHRRRTRCGRTRSDSLLRHEVPVGVSSLDRRPHCGDVAFSSSLARLAHGRRSSSVGCVWSPTSLSAALSRRQADVALRASEQRFHSLADNAPVLIWVSGPDRLCTWFNRQWLDFVGKTMEHELGTGWAANVHPDDVESCLQTYTKHFDARQPFHMEYRLRRHDGEWRWVLDNGAPNFDGDGVFTGYLGSCIDITEEKHARQEIERLRDQLQAENVYLRSEVKDRLGTGVIIGQSEAIRRVLAQVEQVAVTDSTVLLLGETGTGKELFATQIHELSARHARAMVRVNCAAIPATLMESELFGREKGAFTGALTRQVGRFEFADHSTIFLDEIGDLPVDVQVKLLRVLEERQIERLGSPRPIRVDTRIIAATHRNLERRIADGKFREDLFYRLNVFPIQVPPLRERVEDIPLLIWRFVEEFSRTFGKRIDAIPEGEHGRAAARTRGRATSASSATSSSVP